MGRGIETAIMNYIKEEYFGRLGVRSLKALFTPTKKNMPAQQFYPDQGFNLASEETSDGCCYLLLADNSSILDCHWIKINERK
jgi:predicted enzyme involved in methoxymalonyl-ACP biosynthesis